MNVLKTLLHSNIYEKIDRAGIATPRQILMLSVLDIEKVTNLTRDDIYLLKNIVSNHVMPQSLTCDKLSQVKKIKRIPIGCENIDDLLHGGIATGTITEIYGESGSGKTQIALTAAMNCWPNYCVYICTEDLFPVKRLKQIKSSRPICDTDFGNHIFVEHLTESHELLSCISVRLPKLLEKHPVSVVIIDSIAAPFRVDSVDYVKRAEDIRETALMLISLAQKHNFAVICLNQVTALLHGPMNVLPSLGLAWSNMVTYRLWLRKKLDKHYQLNAFVNNADNLVSNVQTRELLVIFAPDLPKSTTPFVITADGIHCLPVL